MKVNINNPNSGTWFDFNEDDPEDGRIKLRVLSPAARKSIRAKAVKDEVEYKKGQRFQFQNINEVLYDKLMWDYIIIDWENLQNDDGHPIDCNIDNKAHLMNEELTFAAFVANCLEIIDSNIMQYMDDSEKN